MSGGDGLFEADPAAVVEPKAVPAAPVKKRFRAFAPDQMLLLPRPAAQPVTNSRQLVRYRPTLLELLRVRTLVTAHSGGQGRWRGHGGEPWLRRGRAQ